MFTKCAGALNDNLTDLFHIGMIIYSSSSSFDPNISFGIQWNKIEGKFLLGATSNGASSWDLTTKSAAIALGVSGGEVEHTLTINELAKHSHSARDWLQVPGSSQHYYALLGSGNSPTFGTMETGNDSPHNNMPPFLTVNIWEKTA